MYKISSIYNILYLFTAVFIVFFARNEGETWILIALFIGTVLSVFRFYQKNMRYVRQKPLPPGAIRAACGIRPITTDDER